MIKEDNETVVGKPAPAASTAHRLDRARHAPNWQNQQRCLLHQWMPIAARPHNIISRNSDAEDSFGWASFTGKGTYLEPGWDGPKGNHKFLIYVEDRDDGPDKIWVQVMDKDDVVIPVMSMVDPAIDNTVDVSGDGIYVPH